MALDVSGIEIRLDGRQAEREARRLDSTLDKLGRTGTKTEGSFERLSRKSISTGGGFDALRRQSFSLQSAFRGLSGVAAGLGVVLTFREMTSAITQFEKFSGALKTATGSAFDANRAFGEIEKFAADTPFALEQSIDAFIKLKNFGLDPSMEALRSYGNTSAALGKDLNQMIEAVADAAVGEFERLKELGIRAKNQGDTIRFTFQGVTTEVGNNAQEIEGFLRSIGDVNFAGAMEEQMERLPGLFSNLGDSVNRLFREIGEGGATSILASGLKQAIGIVNSLADNVDVAFATVQANFELFKSSADRILLGFGTSVDDVSPKIANIGSGFIEAASTAATAISNIPPIVEGSINVIKADFDIAKAVLIAGFLKIEQGARLAWENIAFAAGSAWENIKSSFFSALSEMGNRLATFSDLAVRALPTLPGFDLLLKPAVSSAAEALRGLGDSSDTAKSKLSELEAQHKKNVAAINSQIDAINEVRDETVNAAQAEIEAARKGVKEAINARDRRIDSILKEKASMELLDDRAAAVLKTMEKNTKATGENAGANNNAAGAIKNHARELTDMEKAQAKFNDAIANYPAQQIVRELDAQLEAQDRATEATQRFIEQADPMTEAFENAFRRMDDAAANMWKNFFEGGKSTLDSIKSFVTQTLAEIAHTLTTKRLVMNITGAVGIGGSTVAAAGTGGGFGGGFNPASLFGTGPTTVGANPISPMAAGPGFPGGGAAVAGPFSSFGSVAMSGLQGAGVGYATSSLTGGNAVGGAIGGTIGGIAGSAFGPIGTMVGSALGGFVGGLFGGGGKSSQAQGGSINLATGERQISGLTGEKFSQENADLRTNILNQAQQFSETLSQVADEAIQGSIGVVVNSREGLELYAEGTKRNFGKDVDALLGAAFDSIVRQSGIFSGKLEDMVINFRGSNEQLAQFATSLATIQRYTKTDPFADFTEALLSGSRTLYQQALVSRRELIDMARAFDGSLDAANELAAATQSRYQIELALLQQIDTVARGISSSFSDTRETIIQATLSQEQLYDRLSTRAEDLARQMQTAIDPQVIGELAAQINQLTGRAFGLLGEEQKQSSQTGFLDFLSGVENLAGQRLDMSRQSIAVDRDAGLSGTVASELSKVIGGFGAQQQRLLTEQERAAVAQREAAEASRRAAEAQERAALARESYYSGMGGR